METKGKLMDETDPYTIFVKRGFERSTIWNGVRNSEGSIYVVKISENDFNKNNGGMGIFTDATESMKNLLKEIKGRGKTIVQINNMFIDVTEIQEFMADDSVAKDGKFYLSKPNLPAVYQFSDYYAFFFPYDADKLDAAASNGEYFVQFITLDNTPKSRSRAENKVKVFTEIRAENTLLWKRAPHVAEKFGELKSLKSWKEYLINTQPDTFKDDWITKSVAYLLIEYCGNDTITTKMPSITLNKFIEKMSIDDTTKIALKLFEIITELKDSRLVARPGKKETTRTLLKAELNYLNLLESRITLSAWALKSILEMPDAITSLAGELSESEQAGFKPGEVDELKRLYMPKPPVGRIIEPAYDLEDCVLSPAVMTEINGFINSVERREKLLLWGVNYTPKLLLAGVIGTGKTITAHAIAKRLGMTLYRVSGEDIVASYLGETAQNILKAFDYATNNQSSVILFIDEFDSIVSKRGFESSAGKELSRAVNTFITLMEERNEILIGATNHAHEIDASCLSRFTKLIFFELPDKGMMEYLLQTHFKKIPLSPGVSISTIAPDLVKHGFSGRDVRNLTVEIVQEMLLTNAQSVTAEILGRCMARTVGRGEQFLAASKKYKKILDGD